MAVSVGQSYQTTLSQPVVLQGVGVHSGKAAQVTIRPGDPSSGYIFTRTDCPAEIELQAHINNVSMTELCTVIGEVGTACAISTVEHLLAALCGLGIDNAYIEVDGPEMPILDGSSAMFVQAIKQAGIQAQSARRRFVEVLKTVSVENNLSWCKLEPLNRFVVDVEIDFPNTIIGKDRIECDVTAGEFDRKLSRARTFGFMKDVEKLVGAGFARGATYDNTVVIEGDEIITTGGLRYPNEFVRHKALDAVGDLAMAGAPLLARYTSHRGGHKMNADILRALFADASAWRMTEAERVGGKVYKSAEIAAAANRI